MMSLICVSSMVSYLTSAVGHDVQLLEIRLENALGALVVQVDDRADFLVDDVRGFVRNLLVLRDLAAQEHFAVSSEYVSGPSLSDRPHFVTMLRASIGGALDVVRRTRRDAVDAEDQLLGDRPPNSEAMRLSSWRLLVL